VGTPPQSAKFQNAGEGEPRSTPVVSEKNEKRSYEEKKTPKQQKANSHRKKLKTLTRGKGAVSKRRRESKSC